MPSVVVPLTNREVILISILVVCAILYLYYRVWYSAYRKVIESVMEGMEAETIKTGAGFTAFLTAAKTALKEKAPAWIGSSPLGIETGFVKMCTILSGYKGPSPLPRNKSTFSRNGKLKPDAIFVAFMLTFLVIGVTCGIAVSLHTLMQYGIDTMFQGMVLRGCYMVALGVAGWMVFFEAVLALAYSRHLVRHAGVYSLVIVLCASILPFIAYALRMGKIF